MCIKGASTFFNILHAPGQSIRFKCSHQGDEPLVWQSDFYSSDNSSVQWPKQGLMCKTRLRFQRINCLFDNRTRMESLIWVL